MSLQDRIAKVQLSLASENTPTEKATQTPVEALNNFLDTQGRIGVRGLNTMALGLPQTILNRVNPEAAQEIFRSPEGGLGVRSQDLLTQGASLIGGGAGRLSLGAAKATSKALTKKLGTSNLTSKVMTNISSGAVGGAVGGAAQITDPEAKYNELIKRQATQAGGGALAGVALGALTPIFRGIKNLKFVTDDDLGAATARKFRNEFFEVKKRAVDQFGSQLDSLAKKNPKSTVDLTEFVDDLKNSFDDMAPEARNALKKTPLIKKFLNTSENIDKVSLREVQDGINYINNKVPANIKFKHLSILDAATDLKASQLDAFPEMASVREQYRQVISPYNDVKNYFKFNRIMKAIEGGFGGAEGRAAIKQLMSEDTIRKMGGIRAAQKLASGSGELFRNLVIGISSGVGAGLVFRNLLKDE